MRPDIHPLHPLFQQTDRGSGAWWQAVQAHGNPLITRYEVHLHCIFLWQQAPHTQTASQRRQGWQSQLQQHAKADPFSRHPPYATQLARWVSQLHPGQMNTENQYTNHSAATVNDPPLSRELDWQSHLRQCSCPVDLHTLLAPSTAARLHLFQGDHNAVNWQHDLIQTLASILSLKDSPIYTMSKSV
ncbi:hypothetical protein [Acinetobacter sp. WZC-1]|uniref:hypothetical protein n=1 Tax=Acinetobacter sp. WZC-1 TaxID=3459034 RepID=UPI00403D63A3